MEYFVINLNFCGAILFILLAVSMGETLTEYYEEACYGSDGFIDALQPRCSDGEVIYPHDVYTYAKRQNTSCPWISYVGVRNETYCCRYFNETEDCGMRYYGLNVGLEHYKPFTGNNGGLIQVAWNNTLGICDQDEYFERTHYMRMTYNCINTSQTGSVCNSSLTGNSLYLWNDDYPNSDGGCSLTSGCKCSIQSNGGSNIQIDALDIRFAINSITGLCSQRLFLTDGTSKSDIACDDVNLFERRTLFTSSSSSMQLRYDNTYNGSGGHFWILVKAIDSTQSLTVLCGEENLANVEYGCGDNFTILTPMTTTPQTETTDVSEQESTTETSVISNSESSLTDTFKPTTSVDVSSTTSSSNDNSSSKWSQSVDRSSTTTSSADSSSTTTSPSDSSSTTASPAESSSTTTSILSSTLNASGSNNTLTSTGSSRKDELSDDAEESESSESKSKGPIIGAIVGAVVALMVAGMIAYTIWRRKCKKNQVEPEYNDLFNDDDIITSRPPERASTEIGFW